MDIINNLMLGAANAMTWQNLLWGWAGCVLGTLVGVLPGLGPVPVMAMLLPATYALPPTTALIMLAGIYYGAQYGGSTTAILVNLPGESSSAVTALDGYAMTRRGEAATALFVAAVASFIAGTIATVIVAVLVIPISKLATAVSPAEYAVLMLMCLLASVLVAQESRIKALGMLLLGMLLGSVGTDPNTGVVRYTMSQPYLMDGVGFVAVAVALFAVVEIVSMATQQNSVRYQPSGSARWWQILKRMMPATLRGTAIGSVLGAMPGGGATVASYAAYTVEKRLNAGDSVSGVAAPESANNAAAQTGMIPLLTLGLPVNAVMAVMIGAMMIHSIQPGPQVIDRNPGLFWGTIVSMWTANFMLIVLNLPLIGIWARIASIPSRLLYLAVLTFCAVAVYAVSNSVTDIYITAGLAVLFYVLVHAGCEPAPLLLGFVLGPMLEEFTKRALQLSQGDISVFVSTPLSIVAWSVAGLVCLTIARRS